MKLVSGCLLVICRLSGVGYRLPVAVCRLSLSFIVRTCRLSWVGCRVLVFDCCLSLSFIVDSCWLSCVDCRVSDVRLSAVVVVPCCWLLLVVCRLSGVGWWLSVSVVVQNFDCRCPALRIVQRSSDGQGLYVSRISVLRAITRANTRWGRGGCL